jgi:hypothetical protein
MHRLMRLIQMIRLNTGDLVTFRYNKIGSTDKTPLVLVIAPFYKNQVHGINVRYLQTSAERRLLVAILDENFRKIPQVAAEISRNIMLRGILSTNDVQNALRVPQTFYQRYIKPIIRTDAYRIYNPALMYGARTIDNKQLILTSIRRI